MIFVNSMSDLFHEDVPPSSSTSVFETMELADWHIFQVLTKRSSLCAAISLRAYGIGRASPHIWLGVRVEDAQHGPRGASARSTCRRRFLSIEPLLGPVGTSTSAGSTG